MSTKKVRLPLLLKRAATLVSSEPGAFTNIDLKPLLLELGLASLGDIEPKSQLLTKFAENMSQLEPHQAIKLSRLEPFKKLFPTGFQEQAAKFDLNGIGEPILLC